MAKTGGRNLGDWLSAVLPGRWAAPEKMIPVVALSGPIGMASSFQKPLSLRTVAGALERAFSFEKSPAVALLVNSPGGSAVQSHLIHRRIRALAEEKEKPVIAFIEDLAASGGYMIACAADEIYADPASVVGSIGVVSAGFGFTGLIDRIGVERRMHTAGESKAFLDPFLPEREEDVARLERIQSEIHGHFIELVRARRGAKLEETDDLFSGLVWAGREAEGLGLIDGLGDARTLMRERHGDDVRLRLIEPQRPSFLRRALFGSAAAAAEGAVSALEARALWARHGL
jgi:signal peptide peptidase SppA